MRSCQVPLSAACRAGACTTIEGLSADGTHPCQLAWLAEDVAQCGYCQPGMIMEAAALLAGTKKRGRRRRSRRPSTSHICRCGTYARMRRAVRRLVAPGPESR